MTTDAQAKAVVEGMLARDRFSAWLGLELVSVAPGACTCRMTVRDEMVNGFGVSHGGIVFSLADSAFAFACNSTGFVTVSIENSIRYPAAIFPGDVLTAVDLGAALGARATLVQFSSAFCAPCRAARDTLGRVAADLDGVAHVEVDAEEHLDLVRRLAILRTPTTLVLDASGREITRATGAPRPAQVLAALDGVVA